MTDQAPVQSEATQPEAERREGTGSRRGFLRRLVARTGAASLVFMVLATLFGSVFAWITPPFWGHDEITQFGRAYQVSEGGFSPQRITDSRGLAFGGPVPQEIDDLMGYALNDYTVNGDEKEPLVGDPSGYAGLEFAAPTSTDTTIWFTNTAAYSPVPYIPSAVGLTIARALDLSVGSTLLVARLSGVLAFSAVVGLGLHCLRGRRVAWLVLAVALLPIAVFQAGTVTADTLTNATAITLSALLIKAIFLKERLNRGQTMLLLATVLVLPLCKPTYIVLALLSLLIPGSLLGWPRLRRWPVAICAAVGLLGFSVWTSISATTTEGMGLMREKSQWYSVIPTEQLANVVSDPAGFLATFARTMALRDQLYFVQFFGELGFGYVDVPATAIVFAIVAIVLGAGMSERFAASRAQLWTIAIGLILSIGFVFGTLYLSFSPVDYYIIDGVQGRYFVPLSILVFVSLLQVVRLRLTTSTGEAAVRGPAMGVVVATVVSLVATVGRYYFVVWG